MEVFTARKSTKSKRVEPQVSKRVRKEYDDRIDEVMDRVRKMSTTVGEDEISPNGESSALQRSARSFMVGAVANTPNVQRLEALNLRLPSRSL